MNPALAVLLRRDDLRSLFHALGVENIRLVGGIVRDALLGILPDGALDIDLASRLSPEEVCERLAKEGIRFAPTGLAHGTISAWIDDTRFEITRLRRDEESDGRHARIQPIDDWDEDAKRRDFTINAIFADAAGVIHDPLGGREDLQQRRVRFIGVPQERIEEDYLRILRFFRFSASRGGSRPDAEGLAACAALQSGLKRISGERIHEEMSRILMLERGGEALEWMEKSGVLARCLDVAVEQAALSRYKALVEIESSLGMEGDVDLRFAALLSGEEDARKLCERLRFSRVAARRLANLFAGKLTAPPREEEIRGLLYRHGDDARGILLLSWATSEARGWPTSKEWHHAFKVAQASEIPRFPLTGAMVLELGVEEGEAVGEVLAQVEARWIAADFTGDLQWAQAQAREVIKTLTSSASKTH